MNPTPANHLSYLRALLRLGRVSNVPTVWSNCLAGWLLGGGGHADRFFLLGAGATLLYVGGMFLNDAFDAGFDRRHRPERPIPSGTISTAAVWQWGLSWLGLGGLCFVLLGRSTAVLAILLMLAIVLYDAVHKAVTFSPVLMAACRFLLVLVAASAAWNGVTGLAIWSALALAAYIVGLSCLAKKESAQTTLRYWPLALLLAPVALALIVNGGRYRAYAVCLGLVLVLWVTKCLLPLFNAAQRNIGRAVAGLLAGIVLVDLLAAADCVHPLPLVFILLFVLALLFQRFIPAT